MAQQPLLGQGLLIVEASWSHSDTPQSVRLLLASDQPDAETSTWQHTTIQTERHSCHRGGIRTLNPSKRVAADTRLRPLGNWTCSVKVRLITHYIISVTYESMLVL